jgi:hypothetical protein
MSVRVCFAFCLRMFLGCFSGQVACALWRLLADSGQVPFSTTGPHESHKFWYLLNHVGKSMFCVLSSDVPLDVSRDRWLVHYGVCLQIPLKFPFQPQDLTRAIDFDTFWIMSKRVCFAFCLRMFLGCISGQEACALWRQLADSAQVPFSTTEPHESHNFWYLLNHVGKSMFCVPSSDVSWMSLGTGGSHKFPFQPQDLTRALNLDTFWIMWKRVCFAFCLRMFLGCISGQVACCIMASACRFRTSSLFNHRTSREP